MSGVVVLLLTGLNGHRTAAYSTVLYCTVLYCTVNGYGWGGQVIQPIPLYKVPHCDATTNQVQKTRLTTATTERKQLTVVILYYFNIVIIL